MGLRREIGRQTRNVLKKLGFRSLPGRFNGAAFNAPTDIAPLLPAFLQQADLTPEGQRPFVAYSLKLLKDGDLVLDLGAGHGFTALMMARVVGRGGVVYAFESDPEQLALLDTLVSCNGMSNMELVSNVPSTSVDQFVASMQRKPRAMRISVGGNEMSVLDGAAATLDSVGLVFCEIDAGRLLKVSGHKPQDVVATLARHGLLQDKAFYPLAHIEDPTQPFHAVFKRGATLKVLQ